MLSKNNFFKCFLIIILAFFISLGILAYKEEVEREISLIFSRIRFPRIEFPEKDNLIFLELFEDMKERFVSNKIDF